MARMGHGSTRAAVIYQHTAQEQDKAIATALSTHITKEPDRARNGHARRKDRGSYCSTGQGGGAAYGDLGPGLRHR